MPVENADYIDELNPSYPGPLDPVNQGDDHLRLLKTVLKNQFKNLPQPLDWETDFVNVLAGVLAQVTDIQSKASHVGMILTTLSKSTPEELGYAGTWVRVQEDCVMVAGIPGEGVPKGDNTVYLSVDQIPEMDLINGMATSAGSHDHYITPNRGGSSSSTGARALTESPGQASPKRTDAAGAHTHEVTGRVGTAEVSKKGIDVRGKRITVAMWRRDT